jgi:hypothetical protein
LHLLAQQYGDNWFDEYNVAVDAPRLPALLGALASIDAARINRRRRALSYNSHILLAKWLGEIAGQVVDGLCLRRTKGGRFCIERIGAGAT